MEAAAYLAVQKSQHISTTLHPRPSPILSGLAKNLKWEIPSSEKRRRRVEALVLAAAWEFGKDRNARRGGHDPDVGITARRWCLMKQ